MNDLLRRFAEMKARKLQSIEDVDSEFQDIQPQSDVDQETEDLDNENEQDVENSIQDPQTPEQIRLDAIKQVRAKYLGL